MCRICSELHCRLFFSSEFSIEIAPVWKFPLKNDDFVLKNSKSICNLRYYDKLPISPYYAATNHSGYDYIRDHLGYRLELHTAAWPDSLIVTTGAALEFTATLRNWGFAAPINPRPVYLVVLSDDLSKIIWRSDTLADPREWQPHTPGDPFYTPLRHIIKGAAHVNATDVPCGGGAKECSLPLGLFMPDMRSALFGAAGSAAAYCVRLVRRSVVISPVFCVC